MLVLLCYELVKLREDIGIYTVIRDLKENLIEFNVLIRTRA